LKSDGTLDRYKARLVALGYSQEYGIDYHQTFAPVAKMTTVRLVLALVAAQQWSIKQMDVKNAFLHGELNEVIYMKPPPGLILNAPNEVCRLKRSLYGLKQIPREWFRTFKNVVIYAGFRQSLYDPSLFLSISQHGVALALVYVDDILITGSDLQGITKLKNVLTISFQMKDLGEAQYFLGLEIHKTSKGLFVGQHKYLSEIIERANLQFSNPTNTPMEVNLKLRKDDGELLENPTLYRSLVGNLIYLTITRPDILFAVNLVSQFMQAPRHLHLVAVHRIIRYLKGKPDRGLFFPAANAPKLLAYADADWAGCPNTRKSTTGWCVFLGNALISWKCKKQDRISKSSTEAEYCAMSSASAEIVWLRGLLEDLGFPQSSPTQLHADNLSAIHISNDPVFHERTKHIEVDCHFIRDAVDRGLISLPHVPSNLQTADIFTKALTAARHEFLMNKLMLVSVPSSI
jgi:Reverse transcriptase (RNA-dependent DNA polymerase)